MGITDTHHSAADEGKVGAVSMERYQQLVARLIEIEENNTQGQFESGDAALEIEPMHEHGGEVASEPLLRVAASLERLSDDTRIPAATLETRRWVCSRWPAQYRVRGVSFSVHKILASISDKHERWERITKPPLNSRTGRHEWTEDEAKRVVGQKVNHPVTVLEKVRAIHDLAVDEQVAATVATDLLRRPDVAFRAMTDTVARDSVNRAQFERSRQIMERNMPPAAARAIEQFEQTSEFLDLIAACSSFTSAIGRAIDRLRGHELHEREKDAVRQQIAKVRATADWLETAVDTGNLSLDEGLAQHFLHITLKIVSRPPDAKGFVVLPRLMWNLIEVVNPGAAPSPDAAGVRVSSRCGLRRGNGLRRRPATCRGCRRGRRARRCVSSGWA